MVLPDDQQSSSLLRAAKCFWKFHSRSTDSEISRFLGLDTGVHFEPDESNPLPNTLFLWAQF
jgi:hypothetical protein